MFAATLVIAQIKISKVNKLNLQKDNATKGK